MLAPEWERCPACKGYAWGRCRSRWRSACLGWHARGWVPRVKPCPCAGREILLCSVCHGLGEVLADAAMHWRAKRAAEALEHW